ncbi:Signal transduction histidine kinase [Nocardiopsis dassonvillei]|uniref:Signal transduction histidine kinase n=2 Tax=Nocardiopsis dassonvillei TaxID=2014 RepID=D7AVX5_NOCDD|nr:ATP-binding protein [Nocardiopsis dassonvillei]ADH69635.1 putative signal transduction histidine kinase [Nocardiopsis dassonvillei subsp. dassonvillei DSM 43111]VEI90148.1 Signal transduction histidine kinase [Nocardiopsis dassonvillei]
MGAMGGELPRRCGAGIGTGVRTAFFGSEVTQAAQIRSWCQRGARVQAHLAFPLVLVVSELVTNAWLHTASGAPGGRVKIQMRHLPARLIHLAVTDDGPRPERPACLPRLSPHSDDFRVGGRGLRLVDRLSVRWGWTGELGTPLTVWAHINPYAPVSDHDDTVAV